MKDMPDAPVCAFPEAPNLALQLLFARNLRTEEQIKSFLRPDYSRDLNDPWLFSQIKAAIDRIYQAKEKKEQIVVYGDYDADGVCGSAILARTFKKIGLSFTTYLPHREKEGYGLNVKAVESFADDKAKLIITVDCGISNFEETALAGKLGLDVIITDHHHVPPKPAEALAIIHPSWDTVYPFKFLSGGGVAFKLAQALLSDKRSGIALTEAKTFEKWLLDLVAISTIADMVPLTGENRVLVKYGLTVLAKTRNLGLSCLIKSALINSEKIDAHTVAFQIAPRLNSAGRMSHANNAYQLLVTENIEEALVIANSLNKSNTERQSLTDKMVTEAINQIGNVEPETCAVIAVQEKWNKGVIGLVASKLVQTYNRPALALVKEDSILTASGRSVPDFNLIEALDALSDLLLRYGGHAGAAGFSVKSENFGEFKEKFLQLAQKKLLGNDFLPVLKIDAFASLSETDWSLVETLENFKPFGEANPRPKFLFKDLEVVLAETVGSDGSHLRLLVKEGDFKRKIICFGFGAVCSQLKPSDKIDAVCELGINEWSGNKEIQLSLIDICKK